MTMDYNKVLEGLKKKKGSTDFLQFEDGKTVIRIAPGHPNMEGFFKAIPHHQKRGKSKQTYVKVICRNLGDPSAGECTICPTLEELRESEDKADKKLYQEYMPKDRFFFSAFERVQGEEDGPLKTVECGTMLLEAILNILVDPDYEDLLDPVNGRDITVTKSGEGMSTEYTATPRAKVSPMLKAGAAESKAFVGKSAKDTKLKDLNDITKQFEDDPDKARLVWEKGWKALKDDNDEDEDEENTKKTTSKSTGKQAAKKPSKPAPEEDEDEAEEEETEVDITSFPKLKSRCSVCGDNRHKTPDGNVCPAGHKAEPLAEGERPSKPSKAYLKEFPEPEEEEVEEEEAEEEEEEPTPKKPAGKKPAAKVEADDDDGLEELEDIIKKHSTKKGTKK